jgi:predicted HicB family RNase H-like nuclease
MRDSVAPATRKSKTQIGTKPTTRGAVARLRVSKTRAERPELNTPPIHEVVVRRVDEFAELAAVLEMEHIAIEGHPTLYGLVPLEDDIGIGMEPLGRYVRDVYDSNNQEFSTQFNLSKSGNELHLVFKDGANNVISRFSAEFDSIDWNKYSVPVSRRHMSNNDNTDTQRPRWAEEKRPKRQLKLRLDPQLIDKVERSAKEAGQTRNDWLEGVIRASLKP